MRVQRALQYVLRQTHPERRHPSWWDLSELALVAVGFLAYFLVRGAVVDRAHDAIANSREIVALQMALGLWVEPRIQELALQMHLLVRAMNFVYFWLDFPLIVGVGLLLFWKERPHYTLLRDALLVSGGMALVCYYSYPVAPPRYLVDMGFVDTLAKYDNLSYQAQSMRPFVNPYAAVPSLHVGWAALVGATAFRVSRQWLIRGAGVLLVVLQAVAVVVTGNHFLFDGIVGLIVCTASWYVAVGLQARGYPWLRGWLQRQERARRAAIGRAG
ncbi:MAG: phosphatase PAP2 family protein [Dehalococcoidia bacterium]|nr:phosphatase PAP2 family protein [Dehalococcoidia bacterium]